MYNSIERHRQNRDILNHFRLTLSAGGSRLGVIFVAGIRFRILELPQRHEAESSDPFLVVLLRGRSPFLLWAVEGGKANCGSFNDNQVAVSKVLPYGQAPGVFVAVRSRFPCIVVPLEWFSLSIPTLSVVWSRSTTFTYLRIRFFRLESRKFYVVPFWGC